MTRRLRSPEEDAEYLLRLLRYWFLKKMQAASLTDVASIMTNLILIVVGVVAAFIYHGQLLEMRTTNELTSKALASNNESLKTTLQKMQDQTDATNRIATNAQLQVGETQKVARYSGQQAAAAQASAMSTHLLAESTAATQRPWVSLSLNLDTYTPFSTPQSTGIDVECSATITNVGSRTATDVSVQAKAGVIHKNPPPLDTFHDFEEADLWCRGQKPFRTTSSLLPHETRTISRIGSNLTSKEIEENTIRTPTWSGFSALVYGCVTYRFEGDAGLHHTSMVYVVQPVPGANPNAETKNRIRLEPFSLAPQQAN